MDEIASHDKYVPVEKAAVVTMVGGITSTPGSNSAGNSHFATYHFSTRPNFPVSGSRTSYTELPTSAWDTKWISASLKYAKRSDISLGEKADLTNKE